MQIQSGTVVVVDDEPDVLSLMCTVLEDEGFAVLCLGHPVLTDDLKGAEPRRQLFILDIMLPAMSGIELARRLRNDGHSETPMIAMSAAPHMLEIAKESGLFQHHLHKPFDFDAVLSAVHHHVRTPQA